MWRSAMTRLFKAWARRQIRIAIVGESDSMEGSMRPTLELISLYVNTGSREQCKTSVQNFVHDIT